jgi:hypothetical protein
MSVLWLVIPEAPEGYELRSTWSYPRQAVSSGRWLSWPSDWSWFSEV